MERLQLALEHKEKEVAAYQTEVERLQGVINGQIQARFGRSSEKHADTIDSDKTALSATACSKHIKIHKRRGAKPGHPGHGRFIPDLPQRVVVHISSEQQSCPQCGERLVGTGLTEESNRIDVDIQYVLVKHVRKRAVRFCTCSGPKFVTAVRLSLGS
ncbi:hypothetical protein [Paenibacillus pseudetheri]|jgi:hypothetical protein|uniref:hypothetical protein n=1 Tax=Paenibacillus pseudetheri TaxID=2897682 RepID=UPI001F2D1292|nr:hypothetical protein [Paenibacillus pseudetheri]